MHLLKISTHKKVIKRKEASNTCLIYYFFSHIFKKQFLRYKFLETTENASFEGLSRDKQKWKSQTADFKQKQTFVSNYG